MKNNLHLKSISLQVILALLFLSFHKGQAQSTARFKKEVHQFITQVTQHFKEIPGISLVVVKGDRPIFIKSYGYADIEHKVKAQNHTAYYIASATKAFTGMAAAILDHQGKINLETSLADGMTDIRFKPEVQADQIKLRDLLCHTSGLKNSYFGFRAAYSGNINRQEMDWVLANKTQRKNQLGKFEYTNLGYNIYTHMTDKKLGISWQDLLANLLFKPLKMKHTTAYMSLAKKAGWNYAKPYFGTGSKQPEVLYLMKKDNTMQSAGGLISSAEDMANWLIFNINQGRFKGKQIVPKIVVQKAHKSWATYHSKGSLFTNTGYGLGWAKGIFKDHSIHYHGGGFAGFRTHMSFMPDQKLGVTIFTNESSVGPSVITSIARFIYDWWLEKGVSAKSMNLRIANLRTKADKIQVKVQADLKQRAKRSMKLTAPLRNYVGTYYNRSMGNVIVTVKQGTLEITHGNMHALVEPYIKENTVRVELFPKRGWVVSFKASPEQKIIELNLDGDIFKRVK